jgi:hypothetical protein
MMSIVARDAAPYKSVITHGFVVDTSGKKISKSDQGTGKSAAEFINKTQIDLPYLFCAMPTKLASCTPALYQLNFVGTELEVLNYDVQGRVIDVFNGQPVRAPLEYDKKIVQASHAAVDCLLKHIFRPPGPPSDALMAMLFLHVRRHAPRELLKQHQVHHPFIQSKD